MRYTTAPDPFRPTLRERIGMIFTILSALIIVGFFYGRYFYFADYRPPERSPTEMVLPVYPGGHAFRGNQNINYASRKKIFNANSERWYEYIIEKAEPDEVVTYYERELPRIGWLPVGDSQRDDTKRSQLRRFKQERSPRLLELSVASAEKKTNAVRVRLELW